MGAVVPDTAAADVLPEVVLATPVETKLEIDAAAVLIEVVLVTPVETMPETDTGAAVLPEVVLATPVETKPGLWRRRPRAAKFLLPSC
jgi:hypothetical protein